MKSGIRWSMPAALLGLVICGSVALAQAPAPEAAPPEPQKKTLLDYYRIGGWAMHPLLLCSMGVVAVTILSARMINRKSLAPPETLAAIKQAAREGDIDKVTELASGTQSLVTGSLSSGLRLFDPEDPDACKPKVEEAIAEAMGRRESQYAYWLNFLSLITAVAPMFGLLGTVSGMIGAFDKIGMGGMGKPELLAANIGEAMITTAAGLLVAIPAMFAYFFLRNFLNKLLTEAEDHLTEILDHLTAPESTEQA